MSFVRAMSSGAKRIPAIPAADTDTKSVAIGEGEDSMSSPPARDGVPVAGDDAKDRPGSGRPKKAENDERTKDETVERSNEYIYVLLVPFQIPQAPSTFQRVERQESIADEDFRSSECGDRGLEGGGCGGCTRGTPSGLGDCRRRRRGRDWRVGV